MDRSRRRWLTATFGAVIVGQIAGATQAPTQVRFVNACCPQYEWLDFRTTGANGGLLARLNYGQSSTRIEAASSAIEASKDGVTIQTGQMTLAAGKAHTVAIWGTTNDIGFVQTQDRTEPEENKTHVRFGLFSKYRPSSETTPLSLEVKCPTKAALDLKGAEGQFSAYGEIKDLPESECMLTVYQLGSNNQRMTVAQRLTTFREGGNYLVVFYGHSVNKLGVLVETENR